MSGARLARTSLALTALAFASFGGWLLVDPHAISRLGVELTRPSALTEIRAFYGGLELGIAGFFLLAVGRPGWWVPALVLQSMALGGTAAARGIGIIVDGGIDGLVAALVTAEFAGFLLGIVALLRLRAESADPG